MGLQSSAARTRLNNKLSRVLQPPAADNVRLLMVIVARNCSLSSHAIVTVFVLVICDEVGGIGDGGARRKVTIAGILPFVARSS